MIRCPSGYYRAGPTDCILYGDCFWTNKCLNGGTCVRSTETMNASCVCPPSYEGALCDIRTNRTFLVVGNRDFIIIIIIAIMTLLSKFQLLFSITLFYFILLYCSLSFLFYLFLIIWPLLLPTSTLITFLCHYISSIGLGLCRIQSKARSPDKISESRWWRTRKHHKLWRWRR